MKKGMSKPRIYKVNGRWYASVKIEGITSLIPGQPTIDSAWKALQGLISARYGVQLTASRVARSGEKSRSASCRSTSVKITQQ